MGRCCCFLVWLGVGFLIGGVCGSQVVVCCSLVLGCALFFSVFSAVFFFLLAVCFSSCCLAAVPWAVMCFCSLFALRSLDKF